MLMIKNTFQNIAAGCKRYYFSPFSYGATSETYLDNTEKEISYDRMIKTNGMDRRTIRTDINKESDETEARKFKPLAFMCFTEICVICKLFYCCLIFLC